MIGANTGVKRESMSKDPWGMGRTMVQIHYMMRFCEGLRTYWRCVRCGKKVESEMAAMRHACRGVSP
jgi:hypothetical protein